MGRYTYILKPGDRKPESRRTYKQKQLEGMTTFQLREICHKEKVVVPSDLTLDREGLIRLIMRFRGQKEHRHIDGGTAEEMARLQSFLDRANVHFSYKEAIHIPGTIVLYHETGLNEIDNYKIESDSRLYEGNLLLVDERNQIYTCFYIKEQNGSFYLFQGKNTPIRRLEKHQYSILYFPDEQISEYLYDCFWGNPAMEPGTVEGVRIPLLDIEVRAVSETELPLVIDFGSSNTTVGICLPDGTEKIVRAGNGHVIPSVIGVTEANEGKPFLVFGYDALELNTQNYQDQDIPVFYDIKRWVSNVDRQESVILTNGHKYQITREEMLKAFLEYVIDIGKQQFKCRFKNIQLLAPIRQREKFERLFKALLPEYQVDCSLDEGMAVLFQEINGLIKQGNYQKGRWYHALIIDCGGGTTDLTSGRFMIGNNRVSYTVDLETSFENGDTNFGGNNLTFRILQILKVKIAESLGGISIDQDGDMQETLENLYHQAEQYLPTCFKEYEERSRDAYFHVKNNYYYLFELAERVKKMFFQSEFRYELWLSTEKERQQPYIFIDKWRLSAINQGNLEHVGQAIEFPLYFNQIEDILRPDIYGLMDRFLDNKFEKGELQQYEMIKLTGQSCKSMLFTDALKQYVPGKLIQNVKKSESKEELKMCCLKGALAYFFNCKLGYMKVNQKYRIGNLPYEISALTHENQEKTLICYTDAENHIGCISRFMIGKQLDIYLNDETGQRLKTFYFEYDTSKFTRTTQEEIDRQYQNTVIQEETDIILEGEMKFFVWVSRIRWGFLVLPVLREEEVLYKGEETFFDFEDDTWELNFFDGRK